VIGGTRLENAQRDKMDRTMSLDGSIPARSAVRLSWMGCDHCFCRLIGLYGPTKLELGGPEFRLSLKARRSRPLVESRKGKPKRRAVGPFA
jgi:hypothetical protein